MPIIRRKFAELGGIKKRGFFWECRGQGRGNVGVDQFISGVLRGKTMDDK